ncbi:MAG TPA: alpha/beta hydrolase [Kofleriaceae bacterium]|nr:alpha/beta hydrolase [Kofleriaceae bacterium]
MPFATLPDARVYYDTAGDRGSPVLLVMGFGVPGRMWMNQIEALARHHRVAWFDNVGAGDTRGPTLLKMRDLGRHALAVLDALAWSDAHVVGVSMGGMIAQELALSWTARVRSLSLIATHAGGLRNLVPPPSSLWMFARGFFGPREGRARAFERLIFPDDYLATLSKRDVAPLRAALRDQVVAAAPAWDRLRQLAAIVRYRAAHRLHALHETPTLVVKASRDRLIRPRSHHRLHELIPNSRLVEFAEAGHAILHQCAARLNDVLLDHFAQVDSGLTEAVPRSLLRK